MLDLERQAREKLKKTKLYCTRSRLSILKAMIKADRPLSQNEIAKRLGKNRFDKVTIYRTLESFIDTEIVHKVFLQERAWHYELADKCSEHQCHPHFTCEDCGRTNCLPGLSTPMVKGLRKGFVIHRQQIRLEGLCPECA